MPTLLGYPANLNQLSNVELDIGSREDESGDGG
jgi:hypothetical protein